MNRNGFPTLPFRDNSGGERNSPFPPQVSPPVNIPQPVTVVVSGPTQTVTTSPVETAKPTIFTTYYTTSPSTVATATDTNVPLPFHQGAQGGLRGGHLAAAVGLPVASVFVFILVGLFLIKRRRQKKKAKETSGAMATSGETATSGEMATSGAMGNVGGLSPQPPLSKVSGRPLEDFSSSSGPLPADIERPLPVAFPSEQSETLPGRRPFSYSGYFSGIDTTAAESQLSPVNGLSYRSMSPDPPPPYAPPHRSGISPSNSVRLAHPRPISAMYQLSQAGMPLHGRREIRSPFADPEDDDTESQAPSVDRNEVMRRRGTDDASVASDISDRDRETLVHQMV